MLTTLVGRPVAELDTPALLIDLAAMDRNIAKIAGELRNRGVSWRPHAKAHKCPAIAHRQIAAGAIGVTCAKLGEAEVMAANGVYDILIAHQIVGPIKTRRLAALCATSGANVTVSVDDLGNVVELDSAGRAYGVRLPVVIEVDTGMARCGTAPGEPTVALAKEISAFPGVRFAGLMAWEGHAMSILDAEQRRRAVEEGVGKLTATAAACRDAGIPVEIVSCGGSGTYLTTSRLPGVTEVQAGGATMGDAIYREFGAPVEPALTLLTQVVSRPVDNRLIVDAGRKSVDPGLRPPAVRGMASVVSISLSAEHGIITLDHPSETPRTGDRIEFEIGYGDQTTHLHEVFYVVRDGVIVAVWPIAARGRLQ